VVDLLPLAWVRTDELRLLVPLAHWVESVLPALGTDRFRTVVISLPINGPLTPNTPLVRWFDDARSRYDAGDWRGCIERCRDVRRAVETTLNASKSDPVGAKAAAAAGYRRTRPSAPSWMAYGARFPKSPTKRTIRSTASLSTERPTRGLCSSPPRQRSSTWPRY
jgi:hypothetical protein